MGTFERHFADEPLTPQRFARAPARELADTGQGVQAAAFAELGTTPNTKAKTARLMNKFLTSDMVRAPFAVPIKKTHFLWR